MNYRVGQKIKFIRATDELPYKGVIKEYNPLNLLYKIKITDKYPTICQFIYLDETEIIIYYPDFRKNLLKVCSSKKVNT